MDNVRREAGCGTECDDAVKERRRQMAITQDEPLGDQGVDRDGFSRQGMVARQYDDKGVAIEKLRAQGAVTEYVPSPQGAALSAARQKK